MLYGARRPCGRGRGASLGHQVYAVVACAGCAPSWWGRHVCDGSGTAVTAVALPRVTLVCGYQRRTVRPLRRRHGLNAGPSRRVARRDYRGRHAATNPAVGGSRPGGNEREAGTAGAVRLFLTASSLNPGMLAAFSFGIRALD